MKIAIKTSLSAKWYVEVKVHDERVKFWDKELPPIRRQYDTKVGTK
jgi:hypothetical protein